MADEPNSADPGSGAGAPGTSNQLLERVRAEAAAKAAGKPAGEGSVVDSDRAPKELEVDTGNGVKRRVPVEELAKTWNQRQQIAASKQALDEQLAEMGDLNSVRGFRDALARLDGPRRQKVMQLMSMDEQPDEGDGDDDDLVDAGFRGNGSRSRDHAADPALLQRLERLEQAAMALASRENTRINAEREQSAGEHVERLMSEYPIFKGEGNAAARSFAKDSIMSQIASTKGAKIEDLVQNAASKLQALVTRTQQADREEIGVPRTMTVVPAAQRPKGGWKGGDLRSGKLRDLAAQFLRRGAS